MGITAKIDVKDQELLASLHDFFRSILELEDVSAILTPQKLPMKNMVMHTLVTDPERLNGVDPLAPCFPLNVARVVARLTRKPIGGKVAAVLRPCEIRAFIELVKLKQGTVDDIVLIGIDCLGAYRNTDYFRFVGEDVAASTGSFYQSALMGKTTVIEDIDLAPACKACEYPIPTGAITDAKRRRFFSEPQSFKYR